MCVLDGKGALVRSAQVAGAPMCIEALSDGDGGTVIVLATDKGEVKGFRVEG